VTPGGGAFTGQIKISKARFGGEDHSSVVGGNRAGYMSMASMGEDPVVTAARSL